MPDVVGIRFKSCGKIYDFEINGMEVKEGDHVIVESDFGLSLGKVIRGRRTIEKSERELKRVVRVATEEDFKAQEDNKQLEKETRDFCLERIMARGLPMKLVATEATLDRKRIVFYFTAEGRIDFRELVKDLAARFKTRIEMRQIGVRDEAKLVGGFGVCGRPLCCNTFLTGFEPVSIKMAKKQEMVLNIGKLSGLCSRLMCCLRYEYDGDLGTIATDDVIPRGKCHGAIIGKRDLKQTARKLPLQSRLNLLSFRTNHRKLPPLNRMPGIPLLPMKGQRPPRTHNRRNARGTGGGASRNDPQ
jgi:cell fate regulator YaaT (PSP1 superfamily)